MVALLLAMAMLGPILGPGSLLNLDLVAVDHWPLPRSMWGIGPELPRSVPAELFFAAVASISSGATAIKLWFTICIAGSFLTMFRLLRGIEVPALAWYAGAVVYAVNPFLLTRLSVGHTTIAGVYALAPLVLPIILRGASRRPQVVLASAALAFMGFFGGIIWGITTLFGLASGRRRGSSLQIASFAMHLPWLIPSLFLLSDGPSLVVDDVFRSGRSITDTLSLASGYGFWQPALEAGVGPGWLAAVVGSIMLGLAVMGSSQLQLRFGFPSILSVVLAGLAIAITNHTGVLVDWIFAIPGSSALREPHRFLVLVIWWIVPAAILGTQRLLDQISSWAETTSSQAGVLIPAALTALLIGPAIWGLHNNVTPVEVPAEWNEARELIQEEGGTVLVLPWERYIDVSFADDRRVLNPALRFFGPDIIHGGQLGLASDAAEAGQELVDARLQSLTKVVDSIQPSAESGSQRSGAAGSEFADHGIRWILLLHEVDYRRFLDLTTATGLDHMVASESLDLFRVTVDRTRGGSIIQSLPSGFPGYVSAVSEDRVMATPADGAWISGGSLSSGSASSTGLPLLPAGRSTWHYRSLLVLLGWAISASALFRTSTAPRLHRFDNH